VSGVTIRGVLFDFAGTLFSAEPRFDDLAGVTDADGNELTPEGFGELVRAVIAPTTHFASDEEEFAHAWQNRDLDPVLHRKAFVEAIRRTGLTAGEHATVLYERMIDTASWRPFPDVPEVFAALAAQDIPIAVVSNIAFDIRPAFTAAGIDQYVTEYVLSYEHGVVKPDRRIFEIALKAIGVDAEEALMVGDSRRADGGALALGMKFSLVPATRPAERPTALRDALAEHGLH
jgi:HAD superfamily hydrolase (TIGR01493 family)